MCHGHALTITIIAAPQALEVLQRQIEEWKEKCEEKVRVQALSGDTRQVLAFFWFHLVRFLTSRGLAYYDIAGKRA